MKPFHPILHEVEIHSANPSAAKDFYEQVLGLNIHVNQAQLKVFDSGKPGLDLNISTHYPQQFSLSFLVNDIDQVMAHLRETGTFFEGPVDAHLAMKQVVVIDPDGNRIALNMPTEHSPEWLKRMV
ncbi:putative enzyme related to lactoylglutathione lyase [Chitinophaga skermanii]|uniref:Putative enzyme related to lactoylglutathione lyase n=1 Tax=Chitinophaga skermanii TaxID=331697 RepID=A0A327QNN4_9BACT|nr:VOC family protein [Chitinophaga skermanii]RAJ05304.1 putative enzyme related to lactoylglutathione lyase [Chitinophaga skermanii]